MKFNSILSLLLLGLTLPAGADQALVRLTAPQIKTMAIVSQPLSGFASGGERRLPARAVVPPRNMEIVAAPSDGLIAAVNVAYGETVRKGQILARLDSPQALDLQREALQAQSQAQLAAENLKRDRSLYAEGIIAAGRVSASVAAERQAQAQWQAKREALKLSGAAVPGADGTGLSGTVLVRAPFDGVVLEAPAQLGGRVDRSAVLFKLGRVDRLWLEIQATPPQVAGLAPGDRVTVPGCPMPGRLLLVAPALDPANQSLLLRAELPKTADCLRPFQFTQAEIAPAQADSAWRVPNSALTRHQGSSWLFVDTGSGFQPVAVRILDETEKTSLVAVALKAETRVVVRGVSALKAVWLGIGGS